MKKILIAIGVAITIGGGVGLMIPKEEKTNDKVEVAQKNTVIDSKPDPVPLEDDKPETVTPVTEPAVVEIEPDIIKESDIYSLAIKYSNLEHYQKLRSVGFSLESVNRAIINSYISDKTRFEVGNESNIVDKCVNQVYDSIVEHKKSDTIFDFKTFSCSI